VQVLQSTRKYNGRQKLEREMAGVEVQYQPCANNTRLNSKLRLVQEILKEEPSLNQLAAEHNVHPNQLKRWKATALEGLPSLRCGGRLSATVWRGDQAAQTAAEHEQQVTELYAEIGRLTTELTRLKKLASLPGAARLALLGS
jgi:transposase